jgi:hypothetical protein
MPDDVIPVELCIGLEYGRKKTASNDAVFLNSLGWLMGLEPTTTGITIRIKTPAKTIA